jgi:hypothetical protein
MVKSLASMHKALGSIPSITERDREIKSTNSPTNLSSGLTDGPKDTSVEDALEKTYVPRLRTLEEEVMEAMGIQETRRHKKVYWY